MEQPELNGKKGEVVVVHEAGAEADAAIRLYSVALNDGGRTVKLKRADFKLSSSEEIAASANLRSLAGSFQGSLETITPSQTTVKRPLKTNEEITLSERCNHLNKMLMRFPAEWTQVSRCADSYFLNRHHDILILVSCLGGGHLNPTDQHVCF